MAGGAASLLALAVAFVVILIGAHANAPADLSHANVESPIHFGKSIPAAACVPSGSFLWNDASAWTGNHVPTENDVATIAGNNCSCVVTSALAGPELR